MTICEADVEHYKDQGWLVVNGVLEEEEVVELRDVLAKPAFKRAQHDSHTVHLLNITTMDSRLLQLARDPRIMSIVTQLIGPNVQLQHSKSATKPTTPGTDFAYFPHTNSDLLAVMVMLDDATPENGCMSVLPRSFKMGLLSHHDKDGYWAGCCTEHGLWTGANSDKLVQLTPKAGGISIHHSLTLHGSPANQSGRPRRGIVFEYRAADAYQLADNLWEDGGLQVAGERSSTVRCNDCFSGGVLRLPNHKPPDSSADSKGRSERTLFTMRGRHGNIYRQESEFAKLHNDQRRVEKRSSSSRL